MILVQSNSYGTILLEEVMLFFLLQMIVREIGINTQNGYICLHTL